MLQFRAERVGILRRTVRGSDTLRSCTPDPRRPACCDGPTERDPRDANVRDHEPLASHFPRKLSECAWLFTHVWCAYFSVVLLPGFLGLSAASCAGRSQVWMHRISTQCLLRHAKRRGKAAQPPSPPPWMAAAVAVEVYADG
eukprot:COSAG06_NODE_583_length_14006_cov_10.629251_6_plen_142_part_00